MSVENEYEHIVTMLGSSIAITVIMSGIIYCSLSLIQLSSFLLIALYAILFGLVWIFGIISIMKKNNKLAKIVLWMTCALVIIFILYGLIFVYNATGMKFSLSFSGSNFTQSTP